MTLLSLKSLSRLRTRRPKAWQLVIAVALVFATGLVVADVDLRNLQSERAELSHVIDQKSAQLTDIRSTNAEVSGQISDIRTVIADQEAVLSSTQGFLP